MANKRNPKKGDPGRDGGGFVALPWTVLDCPAYQALSHPAKALLLEFARQYVRDNNGRLLASRAYLKDRGWRSTDVITRAARELIEAGFIHQTVLGHRPNKASWYAVTWRMLDKIPGYDVGAAATFMQGAYRKNAPLRPSPGVGGGAIVPSPGVERPAPVPPEGTIRAIFTPPPTPPHGHHLEIPSPGIAEPVSTDSAATATTAAHGGDDDGDPDEVDAAQTGQAIDTLAQLWELVGCRMVPTGKLTTAPAPATAPQAERLNVSSVVMPAPAPPTCRKAERLSDGRAAIQRVNDRPARKPTPKPLLVVVRDDGRTVDRSDVQDLPAWG